MKRADVPQKFPVPFANSATSTFIRPIPQTTTDQNAASLELGFPPNTFTPVGAGGSPPNGEDFNGILNETSAWDRWFSAGGPVLYDADFQAAISGYPAGTIVQSAAAAGVFWFSSDDDNVTNPDLGGAGWLPYPFNYFAVGTGTANAIVAAIQTFPLVLQDGMVAYVRAPATNGGSVTFELNTFGVRTVFDSDGFNLPSGYIQGGVTLGLQFHAGSGGWRIISGCRPICSVFSVANSTPQSVANGVLTALNFGSGSFLNVGAISGNIFTFTRSGNYLVSADLIGSVSVIGANQISMLGLLYRDGVATAGGGSTDNSYVANTGTYETTPSITASLAVSVGTTLALNGKITANSSFVSGAFNSASISIWPLN